jgi:integrase
MRIHTTLPEGVTQADWWRALLMTCWVTGARIQAILRMRWEDVDLDTGRVLSRAADLKQRKDTRPEIRAALPYLEKIAGSDPRLLPWNHSKRNLYTEFARIQEAAGIHVPCPDAGKPKHKCSDSCHQYGFHGFRYAHARYNYQNPDLQNQMGHACAATTEHYRKWAERQLAEYEAYVPDLEEAQVADKRTKPRLRAVG